MGTEPKKRRSSPPPCILCPPELPNQHINSYIFPSTDTSWIDFSFFKPQYSFNSFTHKQCRTGIYTKVLNEIDLY